MHRPSLLFLVLLTGLIAAACDNGNPEDTGATPRAVLVATATPEVQDLSVWLESSGRIHSRSAPTLAAEVDGRITQVTADTGDAVEAGQLLARVDTTALALRREAALAGLERLGIHIQNSQRRVARLESLSARKLASQTQMDDAREQLEAFRADHKAASAQLAIVDDLLAKSSITAPVPGVIQRRLVAEGDFVNPGRPMFEITQPGSLQAWLPYPETDALKIRVGQPVSIDSPLAPGKVVSGHITDLQPSIGTGSRAVMAIIDLADPGPLRPGATVTGRVLVETRPKAVMVNITSVVRRPAGDVVYVVENDTARAVQVTTGGHAGSSIEIRSGLSGDETIVTDGAGFLSDGARVQLMEARP